MPELNHNFTSGKMNKDLDERLVPNGEYRDALNLEVASSDDSQVGAFQNIKGNIEKAFASFNPSTGQRTVWDPNVYLDELTNVICIGSITDSNTNKIYWFINSTEADIIASYDSITQVTFPLIVDKQNVFNFNSKYLITGVNIIEGMLMWTDNLNEPKKIYIPDWEQSTTNFITHSQIYGRDFIESDVTTIKKYPLQPPTIQAYTTSELDLNGDPAETDTQTLYSFVEQIPGAPAGTFAPMSPESGPQTLTWIGNNLPFYRVGQILLITDSSNDPLDTDAVIRVSIDSVIGTGSANQSGAVVTILSIGANGTGALNQDLLLFDVALEQESPFFEFRFARFGYRYKYKNNEVSAYSAFSNPAFIPGAFDYQPKQGYNLGMVNNIRQLEISNFIPTDIPPDVVSVDILYKATNNGNVYIVDTFKPTDSEWNLNTFNIQSEIITSVVASNQLLRPYDNVPRWAKAQEVTANRLIYANYTQNFNMLNAQSEPLQVNIDVGEIAQTILSENSEGEMVGVGFDGKAVFTSVKSLRTYQIGVAYQDQYGRTTPVFTGKEASVVIDKSEAQFSNSLFAQIQSPIPFFDQNKQFSTFKYYVKETSQEYYNLALDRFYNAEDGNIWLSFPSSERNKVDEETFIILKKEHDNSDPVTEEARYKIIAIENEAPQYLKEVKLSKGQADGDWPDIGGFPIEGTNEIWFDDEDEFDEIFGDNTRSTSGQVMRVIAGGSRSNWYKISTFAKITSGDLVRIVSAETFGPDMNFTSTEPYGYANKVAGLKLEIADVETENKAEFTGRFFVKVNQDTLLEEKILASNQSASYVRKALGYCYYLDGGYSSTNFWRNTWPQLDAQGSGERLFISSITTDCGNANGADGTAQAGKIFIGYATGYGAGRSQGIKDSNPALLEQLNDSGTLFRFIDAGNGKTDPDGTVYRVTNSRENKATTYDCTENSGWLPSGWFDQWGDYYNQYTYWELDIVPIEQGLFGLQWDPITDTGKIDEWSSSNPSNSNAFIGLEFISLAGDDDSFSSNNPAIFETEPKEATELDIYYEVPGNYTMAEHGVQHTLDWFNCYSFGNGVESDRIRDDFNAPTIDNGVKASAVLDEPYEQETRGGGLIFSQIFNSISGLNGFNQFIQAESITKDVNPEYGSIQKLFARDTDLVTLCENKSMKILAKKDALFNADGSSNVTSNKAVLGQTITYKGEYGISKNPESFAEYGFRMYFTDANRGTVLRLSADGLTPISDYGMHAFFQDNLPINSKIIGSWDADRRDYNVTLNSLTPYWQQTLGAGKTDRLNPATDCDAFVNEYPTISTTISFKDDVNGWTSRKTYIPESGQFLNNKYYTFKLGKIWEHNSNPLRNTFYNVGPSDVKDGVYYESSFAVIFNDMPNVVKEFHTVNYSGTNSKEYIYKVGASLQTYSLAQIQAQQLTPTSFSTTQGWYTNSLVTNLQEGQVKEFLDKEGKKFNYIKGLATFFVDNCDTNVNSEEFNVQGIGRAKAITGDTEVTKFNVITSLDPSCFTLKNPPILSNQNFETVEDTVGTFQLAESNPACGSGFVYELISDATTGGVLVLNANGSFTFTPVLNYNGNAGSFTVRLCCDGLCSDSATVSLNVIPVAEGPIFTTAAPTPTGLGEGDCFTYNPIGLSDPDHPTSSLVIQTPVPNLPSWMAQPQPLNDGSDNWYIANSCIPVGTAASAIDFTMTVVDPDGNTGTQRIEGDTVVAALLDLQFVITSRPAQVQRSWIDNSVSPPVTTQLASTTGTTHNCNRGTYLIKGNTTDIGRAYVGNSGGIVYSVNALFDTFTVDASGNATSPTGDVDSSFTVPSAVAQGVSSTLLTTATAPNQPYINVNDSFGSIDRYNLLTIDAATAQNIVDNSSGPNPEEVSFGIFADTYTAGGVLQTHSDAVSLQIFLNAVEIYSGAATNASAVTINVLTGNIVP
tara:strand:- start:236 stop:6016 length:5781 start_codon:yes stop_codon:yes gene_type:complete